MTNPKIYVACLAAYNNGHLHGSWLDVDDSIEESIRLMLSKSPIANAEEWAIHDYEGFGSCTIDEYENLDVLKQKALFISQHSTVGEEVLAYCGGDLKDAERMIENYIGEYDSEIDFARYIFEECHETKVPEYLRYYFDYEMYARDLFINDYISFCVDGSCYVFAAC
jgi:antirestriction protein